ncbi:prepilin-type N-terminal cleavage/methylation domain-containing protein [Methylobacter psychrophilus]|uniref:prepilin-type N-terminal cleavage/methylation domain-containing protein n=1 Tax=Methylobacter psychrophilus TaxID=96941 RepID=UPI0021D503FA|nr:prepilin-type N-terminal cleavage/methylation domain-containing protein [Methylobacter psychrophilus]
MKKQDGYSLIEIMIALLLGLIILAATLTIYITTIRGSSDLVKSARLNHDLDSSLALMINDIRRAGYWGGAIVGSDSRANPFTQAATDLQFPLTDCVLYTYDADADGTVDTDEYYGFRLSGGNIQMRSSNIDCAANGWNTLNISEGTEQIEVTLLTFTKAFKCLRKRIAVADLSYDSTCNVVATDSNLVTNDRAIETRTLFINLEGRVKIDPVVIRKAVDQVKIRNDRIFTQP